MAKILAMDDESAALNIIERAIRECEPDAEIMCFRLVSEMRRTLALCHFVPDVAFLDVEMPGITGLALAQELKNMFPHINIVFVTGYSQYAVDALALRASGYVVKPATSEKIRIELDNLRNPPPPKETQSNVRIQCFGYFEVFVNDKPIQFLRAKSKEMLAFVVDRRGAGCSAEQIAVTLWDDGQYDRSRQKQISVIRHDLIKSLEQAGAANILEHKHNLLSINQKAVSCDYYMAIKGDVASINAFTGEYMTQYSWAEWTTGWLTDQFSSSRT